MGRDRERRIAKKAVEAGFDVLITMDSSMVHQQKIEKYAIAVVALRAASNRLADTRPADAGASRVAVPDQAGDSDVSSVMSVSAIESTRRIENWERIESHPNSELRNSSRARHLTFPATKAGSGQAHCAPRSKTDRSLSAFSLAKEDQVNENA
jgi:hypothetical protein